MLPVSSVQGSNVGDLEVVSSKYRTGAEAAKRNNTGKAG